jgi:histidine triad (HIT) family protein
MNGRATLTAVSEPPGCVFDSIITGRAPAHFVLDEADLLAFLDARPVFPGHTLVVPRRHYASLADLPEDLLPALWGAAGRVAAAQRAALGAEGTFFGLNDVVSQSVPHVHVHVVPRRFHDGLRGFFWPRNRYRDDEEAAGVAASIREALPPRAEDRP